MSYQIEENVYAKETGKYGKSLFAKRNFEKDELVFIAFGPIIKGPTIYTIPLDWGVFIDPTRPSGNLSQYVCHSCAPNLGIKERSLFVAMRDIEKDEEVTIDYAMLVPFGRLYVTVMDEEKRKCNCGVLACRGKLGAYDELSPDVKKRYGGYISDFVLDEIARA